MQVPPGEFERSSESGKGEARAGWRRAAREAPDAIRKAALDSSSQEPQMERGTERRCVHVSNCIFTAEATMTTQCNDFKNRILKTVLRSDIDVSFYVYDDLKLFLKIFCRGRGRYPSRVLLVSFTRLSSRRSVLLPSFAQLLAQWPAVPATQSRCTTWAHTCPRLPQCPVQRRCPIRV